MLGVNVKELDKLTTEQLQGIYNESTQPRLSTILTHLGRKLPKAEKPKENKK